MLRNLFKLTLLPLLLLAVILYVILLSGCSDDEPILPGQPETLVTYDEVFKRTQTEIELLVSLAGLEELLDYMSYDITVYSITSDLGSVNLYFTKMWEKGEPPGTFAVWGFGVWSSTVRAYSEFLLHTVITVEGINRV